ncbi:MAG: hypothetical protein QNI84_16070 [Henriciella sp.]|nr:hypothetical protein [Henriciella sp.]
MPPVMSDLSGTQAVATADGTPVSELSLETEITMPTESFSVGASGLDLVSGAAALAIILAVTLLFRERNARLRSRGD